MVKQKSFGVVAALVSLAVTAMSTPAFADCANGQAPATGCQATPATPNIVEYGKSFNLLVQLGGTTNYFGQLATQANCTANNQTIETLKLWQSLAQAALLSGKKLRIYYSICGTNNQLYIAALDLIQ